MIEYKSYVHNDDIYFLAELILNGATLSFQVKAQRPRYLPQMDYPPGGYDLNKVDAPTNHIYSVRIQSCPEIRQHRLRRSPPAYKWVIYLRGDAQDLDLDTFKWRFSSRGEGLIGFLHFRALLRSYESLLINGSLTVLPPTTDITHTEIPLPSIKQEEL